MRKQKNIVMDGRDSGTRVFPYSYYKLFKTPDPKIRAERLNKELLKNVGNASLATIFDNLAHRDYQATPRKVSPLVRAHNAVILENTNLTQAQELAFAIAHLSK